MDGKSRQLRRASSGSNMQSSRSRFLWIHRSILNKVIDDPALRKHADGFVLLSVLIVIGIVSALVMTMTMAIRSDRTHAAVERHLVQAGSLADAGITRVVAALKTNDSAFLNRLADQTKPARWRFAEQEILLSLAIETGKVDLNSGDPALIVNVLRAVVHEGVSTDTLVRRLDHFRRNRTELETVRGLLDPSYRTEPLAHDLEAVFTVWTGLRGVNPRFAPEIILRNLPGLQKGEADLLIQASRRGDHAALSPFVSRFGPLLLADRPIYRVRSEATIGGATARKEALLSHNHTTRVTLIVFWKDLVD